MSALETEKFSAENFSIWTHINYPLVQYNLAVHGSWSSGFWTFMTTHFLPLSWPSTSRSNKSKWENVAPDSASHTLLLLCRSPSAWSSSIFLYVRSTAFMLCGMRLFSHPCFFRSQIDVLHQKCTLMYVMVLSVPTNHKHQDSAPCLTSHPEGNDSSSLLLSVQS